MAQTHKSIIYCLIFVGIATTIITGMLWLYVWGGYTLTTNNESIIEQVEQR